MTPEIKEYNYKEIPTPLIVVSLSLLTALTVLFGLIVYHQNALVLLFIFTALSTLYLAFRATSNRKKITLASDYIIIPLSLKSYQKGVIHFHEIKEITEGPFPFLHIAYRELFTYQIAIHLKTGGYARIYKSLIAHHDYYEILGKLEESIGKQKNKSISERSSEGLKNAEWRKAMLVTFCGASIFLIFLSINDRELDKIRFDHVLSGVSLGLFLTVFLFKKFSQYETSIVRKVLAFLLNWTVLSALFALILKQFSDL